MRSVSAGGHPDDILFPKKQGDGAHPGIARDIHSYSNPEARSGAPLESEPQSGVRTADHPGHRYPDHRTVRPRRKQLILDSRALQIDETEVSPDGLKYQKRGSLLAGSTKSSARPSESTSHPTQSFVKIRYSTDPTATALQWLAPEQTAGKERPFLYTQSQAIHARSWIPLQDSPGVRVTYEARVRVPSGLKAVMGAARSNQSPDRNDYRFVMDQPIPSYLIALAVATSRFGPPDRARSLG